MSGTSMAAPHVSGLAGLIASIHSDWSNTQIRNKLQASVDPVTGTGVYWSNGRINACKAVDCDITPVVSPSPSPSILPTPTPTPIASVEPSASPSAIPSPLPSITPTPVATASATPSATPIITPTPLPTPLVTPKPSPSPKPWYCAYIPTFPGCI